MYLSLISFLSFICRCPSMFTGVRCQEYYVDPSIRKCYSSFFKYKQKTLQNTYVTPKCKIPLCTSTCIEYIVNGVHLQIYR